MQVLWKLLSRCYKLQLLSVNEQSFFIVYWMPWGKLLEENEKSVAQRW